MPEGIGELSIQWRISAKIQEKKETQWAQLGIWTDFALKIPTDFGRGEWHTETVTQS